MRLCSYTAKDFPCYSQGAHNNRRVYSKMP